MTTGSQAPSPLHSPAPSDLPAAATLSPHPPGQEPSARPSANRLQQWMQTVGARLEGLPRGPRRLVQWAVLLFATMLALLIISVPLDFAAQCIFAIGCFVAALVLRKQSGRFPVLVLITLSLTVSMRYMYWRISSTLAFESWLDICFGYGLLAAELYSLLVLTLGYLQTAWPLRRKPQMLTMPPAEWPTVDVFIPSYNESLDIVSLTIFAAQAIDWPQDKLRVHVLDDGRREEFREFCDNIGVNYLVRSDNKHAKAGYLNEALKVTDGEFVAIFDADHVPTRSFLQICMGWFYKDPKLAMLQTPHFVFSPDPFEKNLNTFRSVPNEGELFYG
ncbi:UNVERIFIED_CONTAM: glycosyltransferase, partial [Streptococcus suis]